jgi:hypothetical protein
LAILLSINCAWNLARSKCCSLTARMPCSLAASVTHWGTVQFLSEVRCGVE